MNHLRIYTNILLGACISLLVGCNTQKKAAKGQQPAAEEPQQTIVREREVMCLYGIPPEVYEKLQSDTSEQQIDKRDDTEIK